MIEWEIGTMPEATTKRYKQLWNDLTRLHELRNYYNQLFGNESDVALLNRTAPEFFGSCQWLIMDGILLGICSISDPAKSTIKKVEIENLSLCNLIASVANEKDRAKINKDAEDSLESLKTNSEPFRVHRNKRIAHMDLDLRIESIAGYPNIIHSQIDQSLKDASQILKIVAGHYRATYVQPEQYVTGMDSIMEIGRDDDGHPVYPGAKYLLYWLSYGYNQRHKE